MKTFLLQDMLRPAADQPAPGEKRIVLLTHEEFNTEAAGLPHKKLMERFSHTSPYTKAELFGNCILGSLCIPSRSAVRSEDICISFYLNSGCLYLLGNPETLQRLLGRMKENRFPKELSLPGFFCGLLNLWLDGDVIALKKMQDELYSLEDSLLSELPVDFHRRLIPYRRKLMALQSYYYQLMSMAMALRSNTNSLLSQADCEGFSILADRAERLHSQAEGLRDYSMQIRDMYQAQIDLRQSKAMNLLTVVSAIFLPLTLLVGWYGMNFVHMPELGWQWSYPGVVLLSVAIVIIEIVIFKKNHLL